MAITYTWNIIQMDAYPKKDDLTNVVFKVHWTLDGRDGIYDGFAYGSVGVKLNTESNYTPYNELTLEQVIGWVKDTLGEKQVAIFESKVATQIQNQINPPVITPELPWAIKIDQPVVVEIDPPVVVESLTQSE